MSIIRCPHDDGWSMVGNIINHAHVCRGGNECADGGSGQGGERKTEDKGGMVNVNVYRRF